MKKNKQITISIEKNLSYDVVIIGGGMSGVCAAISAARHGAKTLIIEQNGYLGGALTGMGVGPMMTFFAGEKQVIKGIGQEIVDCLVQKGYSPGHVLDVTNYVSYNTPFDAEGLKLVLDEMTVKAGVEVLFHTTLATVELKEQGIRNILVLNKDGLSEISSKTFIDATGDADLAAMCKVPFTLGRESDNHTQPMTMNLKVYGVDTAVLRAYITAHPDEFPRIYRDFHSFNTTASLAVTGFNEQLKEARESGKVTVGRKDVLFFETNNPGEFIINSTRITQKTGTDAKELSEAEVIGRQQCQEIFEFFKETIPGFKQAKIALTGPSVGVRQSRQIKGIYRLTKVDILNGKKFLSTIAHSGYPIDVHHPDGIPLKELTELTKVEAQQSKSFDRSSFDHYYQLPYEIMITEEIRNLIITGRCVSADFEAQGAIRTTPTMTALGQAAGTAAMLAGASGNVHSISVDELQEIIIADGGYIEK